LLLLPSCSAIAKQTGGLALVISGDGRSAPGDFDDVRIEISQRSPTGGWDRLWNEN
jgi:hypothetical protein